MENRDTSGEHRCLWIDGLIRQICSITVVRQLICTYSWVKHTNPTLERALDAVEVGTLVAYKHTLDLYGNVANLINDRHSILQTAACITVGFAIIAVQLAFSISIAVLTIIFNGVISGREKFQHFFETTMKMQANSFNWLMNIWGQLHAAPHMAKEAVRKQMDSPNQSGAINGSSLSANAENFGKEGSKNIGYCVPGNLISRAQEDVIRPIYNDVQAVLERLQKSLTLLDRIREHKDWAAGKIGEWRDSVSDFKSSLEREAEQLKEHPDETLMGYVHRNSRKLSEQMNTLRQISEQVLTEPSRKKMDAVALYLENLDKNLRETQDINEVKEELLRETRDRLADLIQWTTHWLAEHSSNETGAAKTESNEVPNEENTELLNHTESVESGDHDVSDTGLDCNDVS